MPKAVSTLSWSAASKTYILSEPQSGAAHALAPDSPVWFAWLAERSSFAFQGQAGSYTARLEAVQRGERYWYAYLRLGQKLRKKYLGKTADLTIDRLEQVAQFLDAERTRVVSSGTALPVSQEQHEPARTSQLDIPPVQQTATGPAVVQGPSEAQAVLPGDPLAALLSTRLHVPRSPARLVQRARLIERLQQGLSQSLILVCAPAGNKATGSFQVVVKGAAAQVSDLNNTVNSFHLPPDFQASFDTQLQAVQTDLTNNNTTQACSDLTAFINHAQAQLGKGITQSQATQLIAAAKQVQAVLGC